MAGFFLAFLGSLVSAGCVCCALFIDVEPKFLDTGTMGIILLAAAAVIACLCLRKTNSMTCVIEKPLNKVKTAAIIASCTAEILSLGALACIAAFVLSCFLFTFPIWLTIAAVPYLWFCISCVIWRTIRKYVKNVDVDREQRLVLEALQAKKQGKMGYASEASGKFSLTEYEAEDSGSEFDIRRMPAIIYDDGNRAWKRRGLFGDHAEYCSDEGDAVIIYSGQISGSGVNTSAGTFHWN